MASRENTIEKIKKLLDLATNNPSEEEATAAALMAQRLIAKHDVQDDELLEKAPENISELESTNWHGNPWAVSLGHAIADNFRCQLYLRASGYKRWSGHVTKTDERVVFMGYETDAEAATATFDRLYEIGNRLAASEARKARKKYGTAAGVKNSFLLGFVSGIRSELEKQATALMIVTPKEVSDYAAEATAGMRGFKSRVRNAYEGDAFGRGQEAGRDAMRGGRLAGQRALAS